MPQDGSGDRSGSDEEGGLARVGTFAGRTGSVPCRSLWCLAAGLEQMKGPHCDGFTTLTVRVLVEALAVRWRTRCQYVVMLTVTLYLPSGTLAEMKPASTPQPR